MIPYGNSADNAPTQTELIWILRQREEKTRLRRIRETRIQALKREIQVAKARLREFDHLQAELRDLERDRVDELEEQARRGCAAPRRR